MSNEQQIISELLSRGVDDWVHLTEVAACVGDILGTANGSEIQTGCVRAIETMLRDGLVSIGNLRGSGKDAHFQAWPIADTDAIARIAGELAKSNSWPQLSGECWLCNTEKGDAIAHSRNG